MKSVRRRRLERKTDYKARFALLKSGSKRIVVRKTNRYIIAQIVETEIAQDKTIISISSKDLLKKGWPEEYRGSLKSLPAAYLAGFLLGKLAREKNIKSAILDIGMQRNIHKSRLYAFLKGAIDADLKISHQPDALPTESDLQKNEKLAKLINRLKEKI